MTTQTPTWTDHFAKRMDRMQASEIRELLKLLDQPDIISFAGGIPDPVLFPVDAIAKASAEILADPQQARAALQYSVSEGYLPLRQWIAARMSANGIMCGPEHVTITNGSQQALDFIGKLFITPGDMVLTARPTYLGALQAFNAYEPAYDSLPDADHPRAADSYRRDGRAPKFAYVMPEFQNPSGTTLTRAERAALLDLAAALDMPIIEDNAYDMLRYEGEALPSLAALAIQRAGSLDASRVLYCGTFSKSIVPALRIGWIVAPTPVTERLVLIKQASDLHVSTYAQMVMHRVASSLIDAHAASVRAVYKARRDAMLTALAAHMPAGVRWTRPEGGMFVWVTLPEGMDAAALLRASLDSARVAFVPGAAFHADRSGRNTMRLSFSLNEPAKTEEGIKRLAALIVKCNQPLVA